MKTTHSLTMALVGLSLGLFGCGGGDTVQAPTGDEEVVPLLVSGSLIDFSTGEALTSATVSVDGISPAPAVTVTGGDFEISGIPPFSNFHLLGGSPPSYRSTYGSIIETANADIDGLIVQTLSEDFVAQLHSVFGVTESTSTSVVVGRLIDDTGAPVAGVPGTAFQLEATMEGPFFLDADRVPDLALSESSSSGYVVVFNVDPGLISFTAAADANVSLVMADSPVAARAVTLADIVVSDGAVVVPTNVSFADDVAPIFESRGCVLCHSGNGIGKDLGGLHLNGEPNKMHKELTEEVSVRHQTVRVNIEEPALSLMLTLPSKEDPPDVHPNSTFQSTSDPDYLTILGWISEGALNN